MGGVAEMVKRIMVRGIHSRVPHRDRCQNSNLVELGYKMRGQKKRIDEQHNNGGGRGSCRDTTWVEEKAMRVFH